MKNKGKLNIPTRPAPQPSTQQSAQQDTQQLQNNGATPIPKTLGSPQPQTSNFTPATKPISVMIAVPSMEMVNAEFAQHLAMAAANLVANGVKINCAFNIGSVITIARRNLTEIFLKSDFDYIWWVDSDMKFPIDAPMRLLKRDKDIVGVNYRRRRFPNANFTGMTGKPGAYTEFVTSDNSPAMETIDVLPHGCVLVKRKVYENISHPHYLQEYIPELNLEIGEDIYFCQKAQAAGYQIWCDQELSREVAHIGIFHFNYNLSTGA